MLRVLVVEEGKPSRSVETEICFCLFLDCIECGATVLFDFVQLEGHGLIGFCRFCRTPSNRRRGAETLRKIFKLPRRGQDAT